ncbi:MAG: HAD hydrolase-like protein, partial [Gammaproteobacteria bacterium]|nr:HAD hydrolase-like protein [Gammaproteobacteria bacterium]
MRQAAALLAAARAIGFDLDGTLIDSAPDLAVAANAALRGVGLAALPEPQIVGFIGVGMDRLMEDSLQASAGSVPEEPVRQAAQALFRRHYAAQIFVRSRVYPGVSAALQTLQARGLTLCCLTNKLAEFAEALLVAAGLRHHFAFVLTPAAAA